MSLVCGFPGIYDNFAMALLKQSHGVVTAEFCLLIKNGEIQKEKKGLILLLKASHSEPE